MAGGVTSVVCHPTTRPVLDEAGLVGCCAIVPATCSRHGCCPWGRSPAAWREVLTEMLRGQAGCVGFCRARVPLVNTQVLQRALQYAPATATPFGCVRGVHLGKGVAASGAVATRLGLSGVPVAAETIALHAIFELVRSTGALRVHLCRLSRLLPGVDLVRRAKTDRTAMRAM